MSTVATVVAKFEADTKDLQAGAARVNSSLRSVDDGVKKSALSMNALKAGLIGVGAAAGMMALKVGIDAVKAAADEEKAVMRLSTALDNVNQGFRLGEVENFVDDLQRATGVADDDLRPALQALVTATGSVTKAQDLLTTAMDISAATGRDLTSVSTALAKASNGQFTQINRLTNGAINPAVLATKDMTVVTAELNRLFGGQAQANAETFAGKLDRLKIAYDELLEAFGTGFIEGITSGSDAMTDAGNAFRAAEPGMQEFGRTLGEVGRIISYVSPFFDDIVNLFKFSIPTALASAAAAFPPLIPVVSYIGTTFLGSKASVDAFADSVDIIGVKFTGPMSQAAQIATTGIAGVGDAAEEAADEITVMRQEFDMWVGSLSAISAVDKAAESIDNIGKASVEFGTNLMGQTPKARDFRAEVISAFQDSAKAAQLLSDDLPTQRAIFTGELIKIVAALRASGVKPRDIEAFLGAMEGLPASVADIMRQAAKQIGDTDFKTEVEKAFKKSVKAGAPMTADTMEQLAKGASKAAKEELGLTLEPELASVIKSGTTALRPTAFLNGQLTGKSIGSGLATGVLAESPAVQAAIRRVIQQAKAAADDEAATGSPSRLFALTGDDMASGVAMGWTRSAPKIYTAVRSSVPRAKQEGSKLANALAEGFRESVGSGFASAISNIFGSIPAGKSPIEQILGAEGTEKFIKNNQKGLRALLELAEQFDAFIERLSQSVEAVQTLTDLTAQAFGRPSEIMEMFGSGTDLDSIIDGYLMLKDVITQAFSVLTDASIVGKKAAQANRRELNATLLDLQAFAEEAIALQKQYEANLEALAQNEENYQRRVDSINERYDALEKAAQDNIKAIEDRWAAVIPGLESALQRATAAYERENNVLKGLIDERDGFLKQITDGAKSFVNSLSFSVNKAAKEVSSESTKRIVEREIRDLGNGIRVTVEREMDAVSDSTGEAVSEALTGGDIRAQLQDRLQQVRDFARNIQTLVQRGLDPALVKEFVAAGVSGSGEAAAALASASDADLQAINDVQKNLATELAGFAGYASAQWFDLGIAQQQAIVGPLEVAMQGAQRALDIANATRARELAAAQAHLDALKQQRQDALDAARTDYENEKARLEAENAAILARQDEIAQEIQLIISGLNNWLSNELRRVGNRFAMGILDGFKKDYPELYRQLNKLMDDLAKSMSRTVKITVEVETVEKASSSAASSVASTSSVSVGMTPVTLGAAPPMGASTRAAGAGSLTINVNAGMGADGADIGRHIVDSLRQYERRNGPIPVSVAG